MPLRGQSKKEYNDAYYQNNKARLAVRRATPHGKAKQKEYRAAYYQNNKAMIVAKTAAYYQNHRAE